MYKSKTFAASALIFLLLLSALIFPVEAKRTPTARVKPTQQVGYNQTPPSYCCGPNYTYGNAKAHTHSQTATYWGFFGGNGLVLDPANNPGNFFFGNTIQIRTWGPNLKTFWYDWSADHRSVEKLAVWTFSTWEVLTITYDPDCMLVTKITSPQFPE